MSRRHTTYHERGTQLTDPKHAPLTKADEHERADLLQTIYVSRQQIDKMKGDLSRPVATITTFVFLGAVIALVLKGEILVEFQFLSSEAVLAWYSAHFPKFVSQQQVRNIAEITINNFEQEILRIAKMFASHKPVFRTQLNITSADENTWPFPWQLAQLPSQGDQHLFFKMAQFLDWSFRWIQSIPEAARPLLEEYRLAFNLTVIAIFQGMLYNSTTENQRILFPEYQGDSWDLTAPNMTVQRLAEMIRSFYPNFVAYSTQLSEEKNSMLTEINYEMAKIFIISLTLSSSLFINGLLIKPLCKIFFPLNRCLTEPLDFKINYQRLNLGALRAEEKKLADAKDQLGSYTSRAQRTNHLLNGAVFIAVSAFMYSTADSDDSPIGFYFPLWVAAFGETILSKMYQTYDHCTLQGTLNRLKDNVLTITGAASTCFKIRPMNQGEQAFSYVTVSVVKDYQTLPAKHLMHLLRITLDRFGIPPVPSSSTTRFSLPAGTSFTKIPLVQGIPFVREWKYVTKVQESKKFFAKSLQRSLQTYQLEQQIKTLFSTLEGRGTRIRYEKSVTLDAEGLFQCEFVVPALPQQAPLSSLFQQWGFVQQADALLLTRHEAYSDAELGTMNGAITHIWTRPAL